MGLPSLLGVQPLVYTNFYSTLFDIMRQHKIRRIFTMGTISISSPNDAFSLLRFLAVLFLRIFVNAVYQTVTGIARIFEEQGHDLDWTIYRIAGIPGGSDEASWRKDRDDGDAFEGWVGHEGWSFSQRRGALARWLVDAVEDGKKQWIGQIPAVSSLAGHVKAA